MNSYHFNFTPITKEVFDLVSEIIDSLKQGIDSEDDLDSLVHPYTKKIYSTWIDEYMFNGMTSHRRWIAGDSVLNHLDINDETELLEFMYSMLPKKKTKSARNFTS